MTRDLAHMDVERLTTFRRDLHRIPELDDDLPETISYVKGVLAALGDACEVLEPCMGTVCAWFDRNTAHATAVRADMDALPIEEMTGAPYASRHPGRMHACGHDGHMAMALALAEWVAAHPDQLPRSLLIVFQPAEETTGGARRVCESGVFDRHGVDRIIGFHLWPDLPFGQIASRQGALLAASNEVDVTFVGKGAHIARWQEGRDALAAVTRFVSLAYDHMDTLVTREPALLRFGRMEAGTVRNAIASRACVQGSLRTFHDDDRGAVLSLIRDCAEGAAQRYGCASELRISEGYPAVSNDERLLESISSALSQLHILDEPLLIAEDFAWYQRWLPGVFLLLGTGTGIALHASTWDFDEAVLAVGLNAYRRIVTMP